jgi:hypothetical protein
VSLLAAPYGIENPDVISRKSVDRGVLQHAQLANTTAKQLKFLLSHHMQNSNVNELDLRG